MDHTFSKRSNSLIKGERLFGGKPAVMSENASSRTDHGGSERRSAKDFGGIGMPIPPLARALSLSPRSSP